MEGVKLSACFLSKSRHLLRKWPSKPSVYCTFLQVEDHVLKSYKRTEKLYKPHVISFTENNEFDLKLTCSDQRLINKFKEVYLVSGSGLTG